MKKSLLAGAVSVALLSFSQASMAVPVTLNGSIADNTSLSSGTYSGSFNGTSVLPSQFQINSASFVFNFADDYDALQASSPQTTGSSVGNYHLVQSYYSGNYYNYYQRDVTTYQAQQQTGQMEGANVSIGGANVGSGSTTMSMSSNTGPTTYNNQTFDSSSGYSGYYYSCGNNCSAWQPGSYSYFYSNQYSQLTTTTQDWSGAFSVTGSISDQSVLDQLLDTGMLDFSFNVTGDLFLASARLFLDVTEITPPPANDVPEPSTALLALAALGGLGRLRARRNATQ